MCQHSGPRVFPLEGHVPCQHLIGDNAQGIDVGAVVQLSRSLGLLRRDVLRRAHGRARLCQPGQTDGSGDAEIGEQRPAIGSEEDVAGFHVTVDHPLTVSVVQSGSYLRQNGNGRAQVQHASSRQPLRQ